MAPLVVYRKEIYKQDNERYESFEEAEKIHETVKKVRFLFQDYAPIPAQKSLLAKQNGDLRWRNIRPPLEQISDEKVNALADLLNSNFGFNF